MLALVFLALVPGFLASKFEDKELEQLADYWHSFSRDDDSSKLGEFFPVWFPQVPKQTTQYKWSRQAKAVPDECWTAIDQPVQQGPCNAASNPAAKNKTNQGYAWSAVKVGDNLFWGTVANYLCLAGSQLTAALGNTGPTVNNDVVCYNTPAANGIPLDYRPPQIWLRNENGAPGSEVRISDGVRVSVPAQTLLNTTLGIRAAGAANGVAVFGGASLSGTALNLFAFASTNLVNPQNGATVPVGTFLGAITLPAFNDFRKFTTIGGSTYLAVFGASGFGYLLRYTPVSPFAPFAQSLWVVAKLNGNPAEITVYDEDQVLIATWAMPSIAGPLPGRLILSPPSINTLPILADATNVTAVNALTLTPGFTIVWAANSYDPDPVTGLTLGASSIAQASDGWFYWGTFQFPPQPLGYFNQSYQPTITPIVLLKTLLGTLRPTAIFRGKNFDTTPEIELLYGERYLPVYDGALGRWTAKANKLGVTPKYGRSGYGVLTNVYTWSANAYKGDVLLGTFDESYVFATQISSLIPTNDDPYKINELFGRSGIHFGGDLYTFESGRKHPFNPYNPAKWATLSGLDNYVNYGLRNIVNDPNDPDEDRWVTTANPFNVNPAGGWEIYRLGTA